MIRFIFGAALLAPLPGLAQGDGPRAYQIVPNGTSIVSGDGPFLQGNQTADPGTVVQGGDIGVSVAFSMSPSIKLSYGEVVSRNDKGPDGRMARVIASFAF
jgi:hypothetical protein